MENQEYVFEEKAENRGDEIIIGDIEFKLDTSKENTSFGETAPQEDISMAANKENSVRVKYLVVFQFPFLDRYSYSIFHFRVLSRYFVLNLIFCQSFN